MLFTSLDRLDPIQDLRRICHEGSEISSRIKSEGFMTWP